MPDTRFGCLPTMIGSLPHTDPFAALELVNRFLKDIPAWPQLPRRTYLEDMNVQMSEGFPGVVVGDRSIMVERSRDLTRPLEQLYEAYLNNDVSKYPVSYDHAAGLHEFLRLTNLKPRAMKGQVTGPITWGMSVTDEEKRAIIYDDVLGDAVARFIRLKAGWMERELSRISPNTIIFLDEPYMVAYGATSTGTGDRNKTIAIFNEVFDGISGLKGVHCCGNTDWPVLLSTNLNILSFDAYNFARSLGLYPSDVKRFVSNHGVIAWGIVPSDKEALDKESPATLQERLEEAIAPFTRDGLRFRQLLEQALLTPSCGLAGLSEDMAERALELLADLSARVRKRYL